MENGKLARIILAFIAIVVGLALIGNLGNVIYAATTLSSVVNESIVITSGAGQTANDDLSSVSYFGNQSRDCSVNISTLVNWTRAGVITIGGYPDTTYNISYLYEEDEYVAHSTSRTLLPLLTLFFGMGIFLIGVIYLYKEIRDIKLT